MSPTGVQEPKRICHPLLSSFFQDHRQGAGLEVQQPGYEMVHLWDAGITGGALDCYTMLPASSLLLTFYFTAYIVLSLL